MKKILFAMIALLALGAQATEVKISKFWAPNKIEKCDQSKINYTIYKLVNPKVVEVSDEEVQLSLTVKFYSCLTENNETKYVTVNPFSQVEVPYKRYNPETGSLYDDTYIKNYEQIEFIGYTDDYQQLSQRTLRNNTLLVAFNISDAVNREGKVKLNLAPRITTVLSDLEGKELFRDTNLWNPISIELEVK